MLEIKKDLRLKKLLPWQNILSSRQIAADIYLSLAKKWKPCPRAINSRPHNLRMALEKYFRFQ